MKMKQYLLVGLIVAFSLIFVACQTKEKSHEKETIDGSDIVIQWLLCGDFYPDSERVFEQFNQQLQAYMPGTTIEFQVVPLEEYKEKWDMLMATNEPVDLAWIGQDTIHYVDEVKKGSFMALDYLLSAYGQHIIDQTPNDLWDMQVKDGNTFAIPIPGMIHQDPIALYTYDIYLDQSGVGKSIQQAFETSPYTDLSCYEAIEAYLGYVKKNENLGTGVSYQTFERLANIGLEGIYGNDSPFVIQIEDDLVQVYNKYTLPMYRDYFETMANWYTKGYIRSDAPQVINPTQYDGQRHGSILFVDTYDTLGLLSPKTQIQYKYGVIPIDNTMYQRHDVTQNALVIPKSAHNPQEAMALVDFLYSDAGKDLYRLLVNGIEKEHYVLQEEKYLLRRRDTDQKILYGMAPYRIGDIYQNYEYYQGQLDAITAQKEQLVQSPLMGFNLDNRMIITAHTKLLLIVKAYIEPLRQGALDDWEFVYLEFLEQMEAAGSDRIIEAIQDQIDDFLGQ